MELVANIWPVVDQQTAIVQRYFIRAYAIEAPDELVSIVLKSLSPFDYVLAKMFAIPSRYRLISEFGELTGAVEYGAFYEERAAIVEVALRELEQDFARYQGLDVTDSSGAPTHVVIRPVFPEAPYFVVTPLLESDEGVLTPVLRVDDNEDFVGAG